MEKLNNAEESNLQHLKQKLTSICHAQRYCGICLDVESSGKLWPVGTEFDIVVCQKTHKKNLRDIIDFILHAEGHEILASSYLCNHCTEKSIQSYLFIYNAKQLSKIMLHCVDELHSIAESVNDQLKSPNDWDNCNVVIVLEQDDKFNDYKDIGKMTEIIAMECINDEEDKAKASEKSEAMCSWDNNSNVVIVGEQDVEINNKSIGNTIESTKDVEEKSKKSNKTKCDIMNNVIKPALENLQYEIRIDDPNITSEQIQLLNTPENDSIEITYFEEYSNDRTEVQTVKDKNKILENKTNQSPMKRKAKFKLQQTFKCTVCKVVIPTYKAWKEHRKECKKEKLNPNTPIFKCKICTATFMSQRSLNTHYKSHYKVRCKVCQFVISEQELNEHIKINHEDYVHLCKVCNFISYTADGLKAHMQKLHSGPQCALCLKNVKENDLKHHRCKFNCTECIENVCIHYKYLVSYRDQVINKAVKIKCPDCDYACPRREALLGHVNREHLDHHPFTCAHCEQQFYSRSTLRYHINQFHKERYVCHHCDLEYNTKVSLQNHVQLCQSIERNYKCDHCTCSFNALEELANHVKLRHGADSFDCALCEKKFLSSVKLQDHVFKVHNGLQIKRKRSLLDCPICGKKFDSRKELLQHEHAHPNERFPCKECNEDFDCIKKLHSHIRVHYDDVIQCVNCKKVLTKTFFPHHMVYCSAGRETNELCTCETCGRTYPNEVQLKFHRKVHTPKVPCPACQKPTRPVYLKAHMKHCKPEKNKMLQAKRQRYVKSIKCHMCDHMMSRYSELEAHVNRFHLKVKPYQCHLCNKTFFGKERLREHLITHTSAKACYCTLCNKKFQNKACLRLHMRKHTGVNPYACEICGERFRTSSIMNTHKVKKHSVRTVSCPLCDAMFHLTREMRSHFKKVHWKLKGKKFDPRDVEELSPAFYHLFEDGRLPKVDGEDLCISSKCNEKYDL